MGAFPATDLWRNQHGMQSGLFGQELGISRHLGERSQRYNRFDCVFEFLKGSLLLFFTPDSLKSNILCALKSFLQI